MTNGPLCISIRFSLRYAAREALLVIEEPVTRVVTVGAEIPEPVGARRRSRGSLTMDGSPDPRRWSRKGVRGDGDVSMQGESSRSRRHDDPRRGSFPGRRARLSTAGSRVCQAGGAIAAPQSSRSIQRAHSMLSWKRPFSPCSPTNRGPGFPRPSWPGSAVRGYRGLGPLPRRARYVVMSESSWPVSVGNVMPRRFAAFSM